MTQFVGPICWIDRETTDQRRLDGLVVELGQQLPVMYLPARLAGHRGTWRVGYIDRIEYGPRREVIAYVEADLARRRYSCGVDLSPISCVPFEAPESEGYVVQAMVGRLRALTVYEDGHPAFPDAHLEPA